MRENLLILRHMFHAAMKCRCFDGRDLVQWYCRAERWRCITCSTMTAECIAVLLTTTSGH